MTIRARVSHKMRKFHSRLGWPRIVSAGRERTNAFDPFV
jgi:hypothetical protein